MAQARYTAELAAAGADEDSETSVPADCQSPGVRLLICRLPVKSPWLNPIEFKWVHGKRAVVEPARLLSAHEVAERVCA